MRYRAWMFALVQVAVIVIRLATASPCAAEVRSNTPESLPPDAAAIDRLIAQLGDASVHRRQDASQQLNQLGLLARPELLAAAHHAVDPEIRGRAGGLLCVLPWSLSDDPSVVGRALSEYQSTDTNKRIAVIESLGGDVQSLPILLRLLREEPSDDVRWVITQKLRQMADNSLQAKLREMKIDDNDPPMLALAGWMWEPVDVQRADNLLSRAADAALDYPADDNPELQRILSWLKARAMLADRRDRVIDYSRRLVWQSGRDQMVFAVADLFVAYAQLGPQPGFERDLVTFSPFFGEPVVLYALGRLHERQGQPLAAQAYYSAAAAATAGNTASHLTVGTFLLQYRWVDLAEQEFKSALNYPGELGQINRFDAQMALANCADQTGDDLQAIESLTGAQETLKGLPINANSIEPSVKDIPAKILWHHLRAATQDANRSEIAQCVDQFLAKPLDTDVSLMDVNIDMVRALKQLDRHPEAQDLFRKVYAKPRAVLDQTPHDPRALNNLAWFCARCGEHTAEAYQQANEAIKLTSLGDEDAAPNLDTAAEAAATVGKWDEAVQHESDALRLMPDDWFMRRQLARFQAELVKQHAKP